MHLNKVIAAVLLIMLIAESDAWRRRRRSCASHGCTWRWGGCSRTCGGGVSSPIITSHRGPCGPACHLPAPRACNVQCCRVDCVETGWSAWSDCSTTCGATGVRIRRKTTRVPMSCGGTPCTPDQTKPCSRFCFNQGKVDQNTCKCQKGWSGHCCEKDVDECKSVKCTPHSTCFNAIGSYECACDHGFSKYKSECLDVDECRHSFHTCHNLAECFNDHGHYTCRCDPGYTGDGINCTDIDECSLGVDLHMPDRNVSARDVTIKSTPCHKHATCSNNFGSFSCRCNEGYTGDGVSCDDIDECQLLNSVLAEELPVICHANASCVNTPGAYHCECKPGFVGNGTACVEIDECQSQPCHNGATCLDEINRFTCKCELGFKGIVCEQDVDECLPMFGRENNHTGAVNISAHECHDKSKCYNTFGSYACVCYKGYSGNGFYCDDLDECAFSEEFSGDLDTGYITRENFIPTSVNVTSLYSYKSCDGNSSCSNINGSYECDCLQGFDGDGFYCDDIDECEFIAKHNLKYNYSRTYVDIPVYGEGSGDGYEVYRVRQCHEKANCSNIPGSFICECTNGHLGDGFLCTEPAPSKPPAKLESPAVNVVTLVLISAVVVLTLAVGAVLFKIRRNRRTGLFAITFSQISGEARGYNTQCDDEVPF